MVTLRKINILLLLYNLLTISIVGIYKNISLKFQIEIRNTFTATTSEAPSLQEAGERAPDL